MSYCLDKAIEMIYSEGCISKKDGLIVAIGVRENIYFFPMVLRTRPMQQAEQVLRLKTVRY